MAAGVADEASPRQACKIYLKLQGLAPRRLVVVFTWVVWLRLHLRVPHARLSMMGPLCQVAQCGVELDDAMEEYGRNQRSGAAIAGGPTRADAPYLS